MKVRIIHYFMMYFFICFTLIHVYLANIEGTDPSKVMLFGKKSHGGLIYDPETMNVSGYDNMKDEEPKAKEEAEENEAAATA